MFRRHRNLVEFVIACADGRVLGDPAGRRARLQPGDIHIPLKTGEHRRPQPLRQQFRPQDVDKLIAAKIRGDDVASGSADRRRRGDNALFKNLHGHRNALEGAAIAAVQLGADFAFAAVVYLHAGSAGDGAGQ
ncbi:MAG: hypothetical protein AAF936_10410 [Pseudomonadota bacterium]